MIPPIYWRCHTVETYCLSHFEWAQRIKGVKFVETSPINYAGASGKGNMFLTQKLYGLPIDSHSPILITNQCYFSDPPHFSLPSTFKGRW
jgi:hypothetical protein